MLAKEWWEARWKFALAAVVVLAFVALGVRPYGEILETAEFQIEMATEELESPEEFMPPEAVPPGYSRASEEERLREDIEEMRQPDFPVEMAAFELEDLHAGLSYVVLVPLSALLGVTLVSAEVSRGTIFLLLSRPISRVRILLTKYLVGLATTLSVALLGVVGTLAFAYAYRYPAASVNEVHIFAQAGLFWLGTVSVLGVAAVASVIFRDVIRSVVATAVCLYAIFSLPDLLRSLAWWLSPPPQEELEGPMVQEPFAHFEAFRITNYWDIPSSNLLYEGPLVPQPPDPTLSVLVCLVTALLPLLAALWIFRRRSY